MRIAVLTPGLGEAKRYDQLWRRGFDRLQALLAGRGHTVAPSPWTRSEAAGCHAVLPLLAWGYHLDLPRWFSALERLEAQSTPVFNPPAVLRWNADKRYLRRLELGGARIVPTAYVDRADQAAVAAAARGFGCETVVVKPQVSGGAHGTVKVATGDALTGGPDGPAMIQPFLPSVGTEGELSLLWFGGRFSHALTKTAVPGDFRVQPQYGGVVRPAEPDAEAMAAAEAVLAAVEEPLLYARVDLIRDLEGRWALMELELIEPYLFLDEAPDGGAAFVDALEEAAAANR